MEKVVGQGLTNGSLKLPFYAVSQTFQQKFGFLPHFSTLCAVVADVPKKSLLFFQLKVLFLESVVCQLEEMDIKSAIFMLYFNYFKKSLGLHIF